MDQWQNLDKGSQEKMKQLLVNAIHDALEDAREEVMLARERNTLGGIGDHVWETVAEDVRKNAELIVGVDYADDIVEAMYDIFWDIFDHEAAKIGNKI